MSDDSSLNKSLAAFYDAFTPADSTKSMRIAAVERSEDLMNFDVAVANALVVDIEVLKKFFGASPNTRVVPADGSNITKSLGEMWYSKDSYVVVRVPVGKMPKTFALYDYLNFVEKNRDKGLFLGVSDDGGRWLSFDNLTHAAIYGSSGYGKSQFFKMLLAQTIWLHEDVVNLIVDPKQVDFLPYARAAGVGMVVTNAEGWHELFDRLAIELSVRQHYFQSAFATPPVKLSEYRTLRDLHGRADLPDFKRIVVWVDECYVVFGEGNRSFDLRMSHNYEAILRRGRALGIHLMVATQRCAVSELPRTSLFSTIMALPMPGAAEGQIDWVSTKVGRVLRMSAPIPGRLVCEIGGQDSVFACQTPLVSSEEAVGLAMLRNQEVKATNPFTRLPFEDNPEFIKERDHVAKRICRGEDIIAVTKKYFDAEAYKAKSQAQVEPVCIETIPAEALADQAKLALPHLGEREVAAAEEGIDSSQTTKSTV